MRLLQIENRERGFWIPYTFFAMFAVIIAVNGSLVYWAVSSWPGLASDNHYERGLAYNEVLEAERQEAALGWGVQADLEALDDGRAALTLLLTGKDGQPLYPDSITARLLRPTVEGMDAEVELRRVAAGRYLGEAVLPQPGVWDLVLQLERGSDSHVSKQRLFFKP